MQMTAESYSIFVGMVQKYSHTMEDFMNVFQIIKSYKNLRMKKIKILLAVAFMGMLSYGTYSAYDSISSNTSNQLLLENVEALADSEGGTNVGICYIRVGMTGLLDQRRFCNLKTNATTIYPCGAESMDFYEKTYRDRCTN